MLIRPMDSVQSCTANGMRTTQKHQTTPKPCLSLEHIVDIVVDMHRRLRQAVIRCLRKQLEILLRVALHILQELLRAVFGGACRLRHVLHHAKGRFGGQGRSWWKSILHA